MSFRQQKVMWYALFAVHVSGLSLLSVCKVKEKK